MGHHSIFHDVTSLINWYEMLHAGDLTNRFFADQTYDYIFSVFTIWSGEPRHSQCMMAAWNGSIFRVTGPLWVSCEFPSQRPVTRGFDVFFDLRLDKRLSKQSRRRWFETPSHPLWRHCNDNYYGFKKLSTFSVCEYQNTTKRQRKCQKHVCLRRFRDSGR